jgi:DHA1 family bicyclomycin/chloramphenicol resistance-like MFS transporter
MTQPDAFLVIFPVDYLATSRYALDEKHASNSPARGRNLDSTGQRSDPVGRSALPPATSPNQARRWPSTLSLVLLTGIGPFGTDTYIAGLPGIQLSLHTSAAVAQLTLTAFTVGYAAGQLLLGAISDATGRRGLLIVGAAIFTVMSGICAAAPTGPVLVAARIGQGIAAGNGVVVGRAAVTDTYRGTAAATKFGTLASIMFLGPIVAPAVGGLILSYETWRTVFAALTGLGIVMVVAVLVGIPETLPAHRRQPPGFRETGARMADLLREWTFSRHVAVYCLSTAGFFTYLGASSFVFQSAYHVSLLEYAGIFATNGAGMALASISFRALVRRVGASRLRAVGVNASALGAVGLLVTALVAPQGLAPLAVPWSLLCVVVTGTGLIMPATTALAQEAGRRYAGTAASLLGGLGFLAGALATPLTGLVGSESMLPMASLMAVFFVAAFAVMHVGSRR